MKREKELRDLFKVQIEEVTHLKLQQSPYLDENVESFKKQLMAKYNLNSEDYFIPGKIFDELFES